MSGEPYAPAALPLVSIGGPQSQSGWYGEDLTGTEIPTPLVIQPVVNLYTDYTDVLN
jgi:hypothetical protein